MQANMATAIERAAKIYWMLRESTDDDAEFERLLKRILAIAEYLAEPEADEVVRYAQARGLEMELCAAVHDHLDAGGDVRDAFRTWYAAQNV